MMMTGAQYRQSLADGRKVFIDGERVDDVGSHPDLAIPLGRAIASYDSFYQPGENAINPYLMPPGSAEEVKDRHHNQVDTLLHTTHVCAMSFLTAADRIAERRPQGSEAIHAFVDHVRRNDLRMTECITDAKGDRSLPPGKQGDPDAYLRVVDRQPNGIFIRGAKMHVSLACLGHEMAVMPTKAMKAGEEDYAVACAVPVNAPGVKIISVGSSPAGDLRDSPLASRQHTPQCFIIFDDVFVPNDRVFLDGEIEHAATFVYALGTWLRSGALASLVEDADRLVGLAHLMAEANGLERVDHIREKISDMILHATLLRATLEAANATGPEGPDGLPMPNDLYINAGKYLGASGYMRMLQNLIDIAGGSACTIPSTRDLENPETGEFVRKYMAGRTGVDGEYRTRLFHAVRDVAASAYAGHTSVAMLHGGGGLYAQRIVTRARFDIEAARSLALRSIGIHN